MSGGFKGTYSDLLALAVDDLRSGFAGIGGIVDAQAVLDRAAANAVARFESPLALFVAYPQTLGYDFGALSFDHGENVGDALRHLAESMIGEEMQYAMSDALYDSFEYGTYSTTLACLEQAMSLANRNVGIREWEYKLAQSCRNLLAEEGRVAQATWSILQGVHNGASELLSGRMMNDGLPIIAELGGIDTLARLRDDCSKLTYLIADDREVFVEKMSAAWEEANEVSAAPAI
jgi:hypothetical protein